MTFNLRRRHVDVDKSMMIIFGDLPDTETTRRTIEVNTSNMPQEEEQEKHLRDILQNPKTTSISMIPTPVFHLIPEYASEIDYFPFKVPSHYIRYADVESNTDKTEYDMDDEDEAWLRDFNRRQNAALDESSFEYLVDFFEKQEFLYPDSKCVLSDVINDLRRDLRAIAPHVYEYWKNKHQDKRGGRPLLRRFLNHALEPAPYNAFIGKSSAPHVKKKRQLEGTQVVKRMRYIRNHFSQILHILELVKNREIIKRKKVDCLLHLLNLFMPKSRGPSSIGAPIPPAKKILLSVSTHGASQQPPSDGGDFFDPPSVPILPIQNASPCPHPLLNSPRDFTDTLHYWRAQRPPPHIPSTIRLSPLSHIAVHLHTFLNQLPRAGLYFQRGDKCRLVCIHRAGLAPMLARKRIGRGGRVIWDRCRFKGPSSTAQKLSVVNSP